MCKNPLKIKNPFYFNGLSDSSHSRFVPSGPEITVPCGNCPECRQVKVNSIIQRCIVESRTSHIFNITLTYSTESIPTTTFLDASNNTHTLAYPNITHIQNLFKRLRNSACLAPRQFRYYVSAEFGSLKHRPHFHLLLFVSRLSGDDENSLIQLRQTLYDKILLYFSGNIGSRKNPIYKPFIEPHSIFRNGKLYSNYHVELVVPLIPSDSKFRKATYSEYLSMDNDPSFCVSYISKYIQKSDKFSRDLLSFFKKSQFVDTDTFISDCQRKQLLNLILTPRLCSKGLGFGFNPSTGMKVFLCGRSKSSFPTLSHTLKDSAILNLYNQYSTLKSSVSSHVLHDYLRIYPTVHTIRTLNDYCNTAISTFPDFNFRLFNLFILFNSPFRRAFNSRYPLVELPSRLIPPSDSSFVPSSSPSTEYYLLDLAPNTSSVSLIRNILSHCIVPNFPYFVFSNGIYSFSLSPFYKSFLKVSDYERLYNTNNIKNYDSISFTSRSSDKIVLAEEVFNSKSYNYHHENPFTCVQDAFRFNSSVQSEYFFLDFSTSASVSDRVRKYKLQFL